MEIAIQHRLKRANALITCDLGKKSKEFYKIEENRKALRDGFHKYI